MSALLAALAGALGVAATMLCWLLRPVTRKGRRRNPFTAADLPLALASGSYWFTVGGQALPFTVPAMTVTKFMDPPAKLADA